MVERIDILFEVSTADGKKIRLTRKQWRHISSKHPELGNDINLLEMTLLQPSHKYQFSSVIVQ